MTPWKTITAVLLAPVVVLILAILAIYGYLQTDSGRALLVSEIGAAASVPGELELELGSLDGNIFSNFTLSSVRLRDSEGEWLTAEDIAVSWSPFDLLSGRVTVNSILVKSVAVERHPILPPSQESEGSNEVPTLPVNVRLSRFEIEEIRIAEPVVGQPAELTLLLSLNAMTDDAIRSEIKLTEKDAKDSGLVGEVDFDPAAETLAINAKLEEREGGLISRFLALPGYPAIRASIVGNGVLNAWRGQMNASAGKLFDADFAVATEGAEKINITLKGGGALDRSLAADIPLVDDSRISMTASMIYDTANGEITLSNADIENAAIRAQASGSVNPGSGAVGLTLTGTLRDTAALNDLIEPAAIADGTLNLEIEGNFDAVTANVLLRAGGLDIDGSLAAEEVTGTFTSEIDLKSLTEMPVTGSAALVGLSKLPADARSLVGDNLDVDFGLTYGVETETLAISSLRLLGKNVSADGNGELNIADLSAAATLSLKIDDIANVAPVSGKLFADLDLESPDVSGKLAGTLKARTAELDMGDAGLTSLVGTAPTLTTVINLGDEKLVLSDIALSLASGDITGEARLPLSFETIDADLTAILPTLASLNDLAGITLAGNATLKSRVTGSIDDPAVEGTLEAADLAVDGNSLGTLTTRYSATSVASSPIGEVTARLSQEILTANAALKFALPAYDRLELSDLAITEQKNKLTGNVTVPFDGTPLVGTLQGSIPNLATVAALIDETATGSLNIDASLGNGQGEQLVKATVTGKGLSMATADVATDKLSATAEMKGSFDAPQLDVTATAETILAGGQSIKGATVSAKGNLNNLDYRFDVTRGQEPDLDLNGTGTLSLAEEATEIYLAALDGAFAGRKIALTSPLALKIAGENINLETFALTLGEGEVTGSASLASNRARAILSFNNLPVDLVELVDPDLAFTGGLDGSAQLEVAKGSSAKGEVSIKATDVRLVGDEYAELPAFASTITANLNDGELTFSGDVTGLEATSIDGSGRLPFDIALDPVNVLINENKPVNGNIKINSDIKRIWPLLALDTQKMRGELTGNFTVNGTISAPALVGQARLTNGYFEDVEQGTILKQLTANADLADGEILKVSVNAVDPEGGTLSTSGTIAFANLANPLVDLNIALSNLLAVNRDEISVVTDGDIDIKGDFRQLNVEGSATTRNVELNIGGSVAPDIAEIKYEEINKPGGTVKEDGKIEEEPSNIFLDFDLSMPSRVFIRGRGLDSEWKGDFTIRGTADKPIIEGYISPVRGQFTFAGKSFELTEGEISLLGGETIDPELSLKAQYSGPNITAIVTISGTASNPEISFSSADGLPEDEVLAQVLFGKSSGKLSALEAVQLAETVAALSGKLGSGGGITGFVRDTLGVDVVSASTNEQTGEAELSVGKYVTDNVYVGVDQGTQTGGTRAKVQIELTPNVSVESEMGQSTDSSVGIFWKWDY